jgi:hypothetical protein
MTSVKLRSLLTTPTRCCSTPGCGGRLALQPDKTVFSLEIHFKWSCFTASILQNTSPATGLINSHPSFKMRLPYTDNPPTGLSEEDQAVVGRVQARRGKMGLIPLDLALLHAPKIADGWYDALSSSVPMQILTYLSPSGTPSSAPYEPRIPSPTTSARSASAASR